MMPEWINLAMGQGGALIVLIMVGIGGYRFFTKMVSKQDIKAERREKRFDEVHESTIIHIHESTAAIKNLCDKITNCSRN